MLKTWTHALPWSSVLPKQKAWIGCSPCKLEVKNYNEHPQECRVRSRTSILAEFIQNVDRRGWSWKINWTLSPCEKRYFESSWPHTMLYWSINSQFYTSVVWINGTTEPGVDLNPRQMRLIHNVKQKLPINFSNLSSGNSVVSVNLSSFLFKATN